LDWFHAQRQEIGAIKSNLFYFYFIFDEKQPILFIYLFSMRRNLFSSKEWKECKSGTGKPSYICTYIHGNQDVCSVVPVQSLTKPRNLQDGISLLLKQSFCKSAHCGEKVETSVFYMFPPLREPGANPMIASYTYYNAGVATVNSKDVGLAPGSNPTIASCSATLVNNYNATGSLFFSAIKNALAFNIQLWRCEFKSRRIAPAFKNFQFLRLYWGQCFKNRNFDLRAIFLRISTKKIQRQKCKINSFSFRPWPLRL
jgi:hypothetical protein